MTNTGEFRAQGTRHHPLAVRNTVALLGRLQVNESAWSPVEACISKLPLYWGALQLFINPADATSVQEHREALQRVQYAWTFDIIWPRNA